ncbi:hypothetical protein MPC4_40129 [Methylocella tundrae]|uniref:Uncharacterized protein n=1 Tax=Methylocella tundrae TaxID=227605 RepID=A0A8B6M9I8_METTU|nr:hypothetical protein MPC1_5790003 [Methylocella tundrae]VTZ51532.1 hypothetical protein MPC4_40129 [Methylocella tundrae]
MQYDHRVLSVCRIELDEAVRQSGRKQISRPRLITSTPMSLYTNSGFEAMPAAFYVGGKVFSGEYIGGRHRKPTE